MASAVVAMVLVPTLSFAQTTDVQSQIQALIVQIRALQQQLQTIVQANAGQGGGWHSSTTNPMTGVGGMMQGGMGQFGQNGTSSAPGQLGRMMCISLSRNLGVGSQGGDVMSLQQMLLQDPQSGFTGTATGFFGPLTAHAMANFQMHNGIASSTDGSVGPLTRGFLNRSCGLGLGGGMGSTMMNSGMISGTITAVTGMSITIMGANGQSRVANVSASTTIAIWNGTTTAPTMGSFADLTVGKVVAADGPANSDGSINAVHIRVGFPMPPQMGGQGGPNGQGGPSGMMPTMWGGGAPHTGGGPQNY
jgi:peptidoglycan hydrolase-like protein with peptidoglycan-binding domain